MSMNLNQVVQSALTESVLQHIAGRIGCAPESAKRVVSLCGPALIGAMMNKASSLEGARNLFASIMSPGTNALIAEELPHFAIQDDGFKTLVDAGANVDTAIASHDSINVLAERIAEYTGVAASATRTLIGVVGATLFGVLKRQFTQHNGNPDQLPTLLGHQLPVVRANLTDAFANALGLGSVGAFLAGVASRLKAVAAHLEHPATQEAAAFSQPPEAPAAIDSPVKENARKKKWWWVALAAALALLAVLIGRGCSTEKPEQDAAPQAKPDALSDSNSNAAAASDTSATASAVADQSSAPVALPGKDSTMSVAVDASGVPTLTATVNSEEEKHQLIDALAAKLGADKFHANITVDPDTKPATWISKLDGLLPVMTLPGAKVRIAGDKIDLDGRAGDPKLGWLDKLKSFFGEGWTIAATDTTRRGEGPGRLRRASRRELCRQRRREKSESASDHIRLRVERAAARRIGRTRPIREVAEGMQHGGQAGQAADRRLFGQFGQCGVESALVEKACASRAQLSDPARRAGGHAHGGRFRRRPSDRATTRRARAARQIAGSSSRK